MPRTSEMRESKFLKQSDLSAGPALLTVAGCQQENVAMEGQKPELKWVLLFREKIALARLRRVIAERFAVFR